MSKKYYNNPNPNFNEYEMIDKGSIPWERVKFWRLTDGETDFDMKIISDQIAPEDEEIKLHHLGKGVWQEIDEAEFHAAFLDVCQRIEYKITNNTKPASHE